MPDGPKTLSDFLPSKDDLDAIRGVERTLLQRRRTGNLASAALAIGAAVLQAALVLSHLVEIPKQLAFPTPATVYDALKSPEVVVFIFVLLSFAVYLTVRYTALLFKESKEPFQYTFCVQPFAAVAGTPGDRFTVADDDVLKLLHLDLRERLNRRIGRLALLDHPVSLAASGAKANAQNLSAHIHVEADYAIRQEKDKSWILQVSPRVRIGPDTNPSTLAFSVRFPLDSNGERDPRTATLSVDAYEQLTEFVYSSVATQMYRQIKSDVEEKMRMFPTSYLQAVARYHEARDFEKSNTLDSYDRAIELYAAARDSFSTSKSQALKRWLSQWAPFRWLTPALRAEAITRLGLARSMIYRRVVSELAGRRQRSLFEVRRELRSARALLRECYNRVMPSFELRLIHDSTTAVSEVALDQAEVVPDGYYRAVRARLTLSQDKAWKPRRRKQYLTLREDLCEAYAVSALGYARLADGRRAAYFLGFAEALQPQSEANYGLLLLAKSFIESDLRGTIAYLKKAKERLPDSEIVRYQLAVSLDMLTRSLDELTQERTDTLILEYEDVLKINPGNIAALIGQGYLYWLRGSEEDLKLAERIYKVGAQFEEMVSETFVGDLKYGLARVAAERAARRFADAPGAAWDDKVRIVNEAGRLIDLAFRAYEEAVTADPAVASSYSASTNVLNAYYSFIGHSMLERYEKFADDLRAAAETVRWLAGALRAGTASDAVNAVLCYALNDYGNAALNYFLRFELGADPARKKPNLDVAISQLQEAVDINDRNFVAHYNLAVALPWRGEPEDIERTLTLLDKVATRYPNWLEAARWQSLRHLSSKRDQIAAARLDMDTMTSDLEKTVAELASLTPANAAPAAGKLKDVRDTGGDYREDGNRREALEQQQSSQEAALGRKKEELESLRKQAEQKYSGALDRITANTGLYPLRDRLRPAGNPQVLLSDPQIEWHRFGDSEVLALAAWAEILANWSEVLGNVEQPEKQAQVGDRVYLDNAAHRTSQMLCEHILDRYYPERYDTLNTSIFGLMRTQLGAADKGRFFRKETALLFAIRQWQDSDPASTFYPYLLSQYRETLADLAYNSIGHRPFRDRKFTMAAEYFRRACRMSDTNAFFQSNYASALEQVDLQLTDDGPDTPARREEARKVRAAAIRAFERACELRPQDADIRESLVRLRSRDWAFAHGLGAGLKAFKRTYLLRFQFATAATEDFVGPGEALRDGLQQSIAKCRKTLKDDLGVTLPGVNLNDNTEFEGAQFCLLIRDVPVVYGRFAKTEPEDRWAEVVEKLERVARDYASRYFGAQDAASAWMQAPGAEDWGGVLEPESLAAAALTFRGLLDERVPVKATATILSTLRRGRSRGLDLVALGEEIRSDPAIRQRLDGNGVQRAQASRFLEIGEELERRIDRTVDRTWTEPLLYVEADLLQDLAGRIDAWRQAHEPVTIGIVASPRNRPFTRRLLLEANFSATPVLSSREILPALADRIDDRI